ncbi:MAG: FtsX-like permease family protein [Defluviitaleaceae bacterium]|nr:FtsX-like permease family protein [Defluviitaleaceae bacterium]
MRITDLFTMAIRNLFKRKLRTFLTVLAVIFGATCIIVMISLGVAVNMNFEQQIAAMGHRALRINIHQNWSPQPGQIAVLDDDVVARINALPYVEIATPFFHSNLNIVSGRYVAQHLSVIGIKPEAMEPLGLTVMEGHNLTDSEELHIVFGSQARSRFMNPRNQGGGNWWMMGAMQVENTVDLLSLPLRASYRWEFGQPQPPGGAPPGQGSGGAIRPYIIDGVGILDPGDGMDWEALNSAFMPLAQVQRIEADRARWQEQQGGGGGGGGIWMDQWGNVGVISDEGYRQVVLLVHSSSDLRPAVAALEDMGINPDVIWYEAMWVTAQQDTTDNLQNMLLAIGVVSLIISAIGIANTMVMSIYERTKEIGVMKVIGATVKDIRRLFLLEASMIGAIGGVLGLGMSALISFGLNSVENFELFATTPAWMPAQTAGDISFIPLWLYGLGFVFSVAVGLISGFFPARRATRISALAAIRTD